ncbi:MAG: hydantoinase B/oxoprolinase family protein [Deltaproteobacteria bacterium]|nr:hydantoinase B/oxoprolinase family protein [Deltaproteobacteria bacterium]
MVDPITVEIVQNRLIEIGKEGGITLVKTAASPIVVHSKDLGFNIADHRGYTLAYSSWMPRHGTTLRYMLQACIRDFGEDIHPGDMFMLNDPYSGALHVFDIAVIAPVYFDEELIGWTACATHHPDIGAKAPGIFYDAEDCWQEGLNIPPLKLVERGRIREDVFRLFLKNVRLPDTQAIDLKAQIAANNVAKARLVELAARYGVDTLKACYDEIIQFSEQKTRERIGLLPDGAYRYEDVIDFRGLHRLQCVLGVEGDTLHFDFTGTDPQAESFINSTLACTVANVHNIIICLLIPDIEANEGCFRPIKMTIPEGTLLNSVPPNPCSGASIIGGRKAQSLALGVLSQAMLRSSLKWRATASWSSAHLELNLAGKDYRGKWFFTTVRETSMLGGGARAMKDGLDVSNIAGSTNTSVPNVEQTEERYPWLYLERSLRTDGEGAGKFRSGFGGETVIKLHGTDALTLRASVIGMTVVDSGLEGGWGGANMRIEIKRETDVAERLDQGKWPEFSTASGKLEILGPRTDPLHVSPKDILRIACSSGGGFGKPEDREPERVLSDVLEGMVTRDRAKKVYGVVLMDNGKFEVDIDETNKLRSARNGKQEEGRNG